MSYIEPIDMGSRYEVVAAYMQEDLEKLLRGEQIKFKKGVLIDVKELFDLAAAGATDPYRVENHLEAMTAYELFKDVLMEAFGAHMGDPKRARLEILSMQDLVNTMDATERVPEMFEDECNNLLRFFRQLRDKSSQAAFSRHCGRGSKYTYHS